MRVKLQVFVIAVLMAVTSSVARADVTQFTNPYDSGGINFLSSLLPYDFSKINGPTFCGESICTYAPGHDTLNGFFSGIVNDSVSNPGPPLPNVTFTPNGDTFEYVIDTSYNNTYGVPFLSAQHGSISNSVTVTLPSGNLATAIGFFYGTYNGTLPVTQVDVYVGTDKTSFTSLAAATSTPRFLGFTSTSAITSVVFVADPSAASGLDFTQFVVGSVPEPSPGLLFGVGLALVGTIVRRKRS